MVNTNLSTTVVSAGTQLRSGLSLDDVCAIGLGTHPSEVLKIGEGSNGCGAFKLRVAGKWLKCYECATPERARMVEVATTALEYAGVPIPRVHQVVDHVVLAEWVHGKPLCQANQRATLTKLASYQARIHLADVPMMMPAVKRFLHLEWLLERVIAAGCNYVASERVEKVCEAIVGLVPVDLKLGVVQPDFIKSNVIETPHGELVVVDNEFLGLGLGYEFDILNASRVNSGDDEGLFQEYLNAYAKSGNCGTLLRHERFWDICYLAKLIGKHFAKGDFEMGELFLDLLESKIQ